MTVAVTKRAEKRERIKVACLLLRKGYGYTDTVKALETQYGVSEKTAKNYVKEARSNYVLTPEHLQTDAYVDYERSEYALRLALEQNKIDLVLNGIGLRDKQRKELTRHGHTQGQFSADDSISDTLAEVFQDLKYQEDQSE